ncbi:MAG: aldo/keto reductase [Opitutales bacterium]
MNYKRLGSSGIVVSDICMGTMTFGSSCDEAESFRIMDRALDAGITFFDTAELYPIPPQKDWVFETENIVGRWLKTKDRSAVIIATKVAGPGHGWFKPPVRNGLTAMDRHSIRTAIEGSLKRLGTDYIDLYQTHWPDHDFGYEETLTALNELVEAGKVRVIGSSNETPWGAMKADACAKELGLLNRYETIQNNFSLANRRFEDSLADICTREGLSCLPYSPLAGGVLTGKYNTDTPPADARFSRYIAAGERQRAMASRFLNEGTLATTAELMKLAEEIGSTATAIATAWSKQFDWVASTIVGANTVDQLEQILEGDSLEITPEINSRIDEISKQYPYPMG